MIVAHLRIRHAGPSCIGTFGSVLRIQAVPTSSFSDSESGTVSIATVCGPLQMPLAIVVSWIVKCVHCGYWRRAYHVIRPTVSRDSAVFVDPLACLP